MSLILLLPGLPQQHTLPLEPSLPSDPMGLSGLYVFYFIDGQDGGLEGAVAVVCFNCLLKPAVFRASKNGLLDCCEPSEERNRLACVFFSLFWFLEIGGCY